MRELLPRPSSSAGKGITLGEGIHRRGGWGWLRLLWFGSSLATVMLSSLLGPGNGPAAVAGSGEGAAARLPRSRVGR